MTIREAWAMLKPGETLKVERPKSSPDALKLTVIEADGVTMRRNRIDGALIRSAIVCPIGFCVQQLLNAVPEKVDR